MSAPLVAGAYRRVAGELPLHFACDSAHRRTSATGTAEHAVAKLILEAFPEGAYLRSSFGQRPLLFVFGHDMLPPGYEDRLKQEDPDAAVAPQEEQAVSVIGLDGG